MTMQRKAPNKMPAKVEMNGMIVNETRFDGEQEWSAPWTAGVLEGEGMPRKACAGYAFPELEYKKSTNLSSTASDGWRTEKSVPHSVPTVPDGSKSPLF